MLYHHDSTVLMNLLQMSAAFATASTNLCNRYRLAHSSSDAAQSCLAPRQHRQWWAGMQHDAGYKARHVPNTAPISTIGGNSTPVNTLEARYLLYVMAATLP